jgi:predicted nucleic acid-binding protein
MIAIDTNILAYIEGIDDVDRQALARAVVRGFPGKAVVIPMQVLGELFNVLVRRGWPAMRAREAIFAWHDGYRTPPTTETAMIDAIDLAVDHRLRIWDSVMMSVSAEAGCRLLLSEDLQDGFTWRGVTVVNPFAEQRHPLLESLLNAPEDEN